MKGWMIKAGGKLVPFTWGTIEQDAWDQAIVYWAIERPTLEREGFRAVRVTITEEGK